MGMAGSSITFEVEVFDREQLAEALGIPEEEVYVELAPGVTLTYSATKIERRGGGATVLPAVVGFVLDVTAQVTAAAAVGIWALLFRKLREGGAQNITIVNWYTINMVSQAGKDDDEDAAEKAQKIQQIQEIMKHLGE